jgi:tRNA pseudouridine55 synthase
MNIPLPTDGFLIIDKPAGISSAKAVSEVKRLLKCKKIGHGGTLDPLASGVLPLAIGEATKAFNYIASTTKEYTFTITFGEERATDDAEGAVINSTSFIPSIEDVARVLPDFTGAIMQVPPSYSALKIDGERAYKMARAGKNVHISARPITIKEIKLVSQGSDGKTVTLSTLCSKGTYIRSLARDIARKCNSLGYVSMLRRIAVGKFHEKGAILLDNLSNLVHSGALFEKWIPIELALDDIPAIELDSDEAQALRYGKTISMNKQDGNYVALHQGHILALAEVKGSMLRSQRIFNIN